MAMFRLRLRFWASSCSARFLSRSPFCQFILNYKNQFLRNHQNTYGPNCLSSHKSCHISKKRYCKHYRSEHLLCTYRCQVFPVICIALCDQHTAFSAYNTMCHKTVIQAVCDDISDLRVFPAGICKYKSSRPDLWFHGTGQNHIYRNSGPGKYQQQQTCKSKHREKKPSCFFCCFHKSCLSFIYLTAEACPAKVPS